MSELKSPEEIEVPEEKELKEAPKEEKKEEKVKEEEKKVSEVDEDIENLRKIIEQIMNNVSDVKLREEYKVKLNKFINEFKTKEERDEIVRKFVSYFINLADKGGKYRKIASAKFLQWFSLPDGQIVVAYMFKPKFRARVLHVIGQAILTATRVSK